MQGFSSLLLLDVLRFEDLILGSSKDYSSQQWPPSLVHCLLPLGYLFVPLDCNPLLVEHLHEVPIELRTVHLKLGPFIGSPGGLRVDARL